MTQFDQVVLAGGGNRCWWQAGFWHVLNEKIPQTPKKLIAISAGAATACLFYARPGKSGAEWGLNYYAHALEKVRKNANWANLFSSDPVFPHHQIYRTALKNILGGGFDLIKRGPEIEIGLAKTPAWLGPRLSVAVGLTVYNLEKYFKKSLHPTLGKTIGFTREFIRAQDCSSEDDLIELILQSSCTPPFTPVMYRGGQAVLDGGLVDNVLIDGLSPAPEGIPRSEVLVLLTRRYSQPDYLIKELPGLRLTYVQPSRPVPISSWDYAHHELMPLTYQQGRADAETAFSGGLLG
ncbi:MAG: patatin-like phospholipase family protein [Polynucleobacter victoriensis]